MNLARLLSCAFFLFSTAALAQTPRALFDEGAALYAKGEFAAAALKFEASFAARPVPVTKFNTARAWEQAGETLKAIDAWQAWLAMSPSSPERPAAEQSLRVLGEKLAKLGVQAFTITSLPVGARVSVDGVVVGVAPITVEVTPTRHLVRLEAPGRVAVERSYVVPADRPAAETYELPPADDTAPAPLVVTQPTVPVRPEDSVEVHIDSPEKETRLFRSGGDPKGECRAPCDVPIARASDVFFVSGGGLLPSKTFVLLDHAHGGRVSLHVKQRGSSTWFTVGGSLFLLAAVVGFPVAFTTAISRGNQVWTEPQTIGFGISLGVGIAGVLGLIAVGATNGTSVTFDGE